MLPHSVYQLITQVMVWLRSYIQAYEIVNPPTCCQVIDIKEDGKKEVCVVVQCAKEASIFESSLAAIVEDEARLGCFSKRDVQMIILAQEAQNQPKYAIVAQLFGGEQTVLRLRETGTSDYIERTALDISIDMSIIEGLSRADAFLVGYVAASEKMLHDISWALSKRLA